MSVKKIDDGTNVFETITTKRSVGCKTRKYLNSHNILNNYAYENLCKIRYIVNSYRKRIAV